MGSRPDHTTSVATHVGVVAAAAAAIAWWFGSGLQPLWWAAWLAPLPLLAYSIRTRARWAALASFIAFSTGGLNQWHYLHDVIRLPLPVVVLGIATPALLMTLAIVLFRALMHRGRVLSATLAAPLAATGLACLSAAMSPHGTFGDIAYSQMDALPVIQIAAVLGLWGIGFLVWMLPTALAATTAPGLSTQRRLAAAALGLSILALAVGYGTWRLHDDGIATSKQRIGLVSIGDSKDVQADLAKASGKHMLERYLAESDRLAAAGAQTIVAPESALLVRSHAIPALADLSTRDQVRILIGVEDHSDPHAKRNTALVFEPGRTITSYYKQHLIPGFEDRYTPGDMPTMLIGKPRIGIAICKDMDFTTTGSDYARRDTQLLLVPAWDFGDDAWLHARMAILRGVEGGFAVARSARDGLLTLSDDRGRVVAQASSANTNAVVALIGELPLRRTQTLAGYWGDAFGWLCLIAASGLASSLVFRRRRQPSAKGQS